MKKFLFAIAVSVTLAAGAQTKEGRVVYKRTLQMAGRATMVINGQDMSSQLPKSRTDEFEMLFANNQSLWQFLPSANDDGGGFGGGPGGGGVMVRMGNSGNSMAYTNLDKGLKVEQKEVGDKTYIVEDSIKKLSWKLTNETKEILGHVCRKAITQTPNTRFKMSMENGEMKREQVTDTVATAAWFTTDVPVALGPVYAGQLPGLILLLDINNGQTLYEATEFTPKVNASKIKEPKEGKKATAAEFDKAQQKFMEEMRQRFAGGGGQIRVGGN